MTDVVDKVAKAILKARYYDREPEMYGNNLDSFFSENIDEKHMIIAKDEARSAIESMRDAIPNDEMMSAMWSMSYCNTKESFYSCWSSMIDAALKGEAQ